MTAVTLAPAWVDDDLGYSDFYARYHRALTSYLRMGFRDADVEAVAQETFCRALAHWGEVGNMASPWPWLAVTARNLARNNIRDERASRASGLEVFADTACSSDDVAEQVEAADELRRLAQAMAVLTPLQKRLVTVMIEEGLTGAQLARRLGMRQGAVRMHLCRMRLRLGERFASLGGVLGIAPAALLPALRRLLRPRRYGVQQAALSIGSTALAVSAAVMAIAVGTGVVSGAGSSHASKPAPKPVLSSSDSTASSTAVQPARSRAAEADATAPTAAVPAVGYRAKVSQTPTQSGETADVWVSVDGPVGRVYAGARVLQGSPALEAGVPCPTGGC